MHCLWTILKNTWHYIKNFITIKENQMKITTKRKKESARQYHKGKALNKIFSDKNIDIMENLELTETKTGVKVNINQKYTLEEVVMLKPQKAKTKKETDIETSTERKSKTHKQNGVPILNW